nr:reverse transcriptase domain-containing protein [Tanacetum cinerariifolium]
ELAHNNPEITESDFDFEEEIHLIESLLYDNSSSRPPKERNAEEERIKREHVEYISRMEMLFTINPRPRPTVNANTIIESISSLPILVQDGDSQREEIDIVTDTDDVLPPSVEKADDSEGEIDVVEELPRDNSIPLTEDEASVFDYQDDPSFPRPPPEPPDAEFDFKPNYEEEILVVMNDKDEFDDDYFPFMFVIRIFLPYLICFKIFLSFLSAESEDTIFDPGKDYAQNVKNQSKTRQYQHKIGSQQQKPDQRFYFPPTAMIPLRSRKHTSNVVEPEIRTIVEMADNRTMALMLQAPIKGYEDAIVVPLINANNFELKQTLINLVQSNQFTGRQDPHNHLRFFNKVTSTFRHPEKLLEDLKELVEYNNSPSRDHSIFLNDDENKESLENSSNEIAAFNSNQEKEKPPQDSDIRQLIREECCIEVSEEQKQKIKDTILELVKICRQKERICMHDNVNDLIESALNSKLLSINSQRLDKKEQEVENVVEQPTERGTRVEKSLQNFRVIHKSSISLNNTSQISLIHAVTPILSTKEPEHSLSMRYEHLSITLETESDKVTESNAKNLLPIPSEYEVTSEDESKCDMPDKDDCSPAFTTFSNPFFNDNDDLDSSDNESLPKEDVSTEEFKVYLNPLFDEDEINSDKLNPHCLNIESDFVESLLNRDTFIDSSSKFDFSGELAHVNLEITESDFDLEEEIHLSESLLYDNSSSRPPKEHNAKEERIKREHAEYISLEDSDSQREEIDIITDTDDVLPQSVENDNDSEGEIDVVEELLSDNSIPFTEDEASDSDYQDDPSFPRPPPEPPDAEFDFEPDVGKEIPVVMNDKDEFDDDYFPFMFVIQIFLPYLICSKMFISFLSAENVDTIFDPGFTPHRLKFLVFGYLSRSKRSSHPLIEISLGKSISLINIA